MSNANTVPSSADRARRTLSVLRSAAGAVTWLSPAWSWRLFGLGAFDGDPRTALVGRLFGVRDLALGRAVMHPDPAVRRAALGIGVAVDSVDVVATCIALRRGAPKPVAVLIAGGAALFVGLGVTALAGDRTDHIDPHPALARS